MIQLRRTLSRAYDPDRDWWPVRGLLVTTYPLVPAGFNWDVRRWDGQRYHRKDLAPNPVWAGRAQLWETPQGRLLGVAHPENGPDEVNFELHPDYRLLLDEMLV